MSNRRHWLEVAEAISVAASFVGLAMAMLFQQAIYGLAPVSLSLLLSLINRRRLAQQMEQQTADTTQVKQIKRAINALNAANAQLKQEVQNLVPNPELASRVEELNQVQQGLRLSLVPMQSQLDDLGAQFKKRPELEQIESLAVVISALKQSLDQLPQPTRLHLQVSEFQHQLEQVAVQLSEHSQRVQRLETAIAQVQQQLFDLE